ncbi:hypothetical protein [uncultured Mitsuokella sp.]|uniref:DUF7657 domain-containing protein n=1 Tax=uncultured Mitsuokella sp. TaxID=453120 RepID=UPI00266F5DDB|nr:hypothetical protein [uncultured Mitsuokella sp.]
MAIKQIYNNAFKYRWLIGISLWLIFTLLEIHGSSIGIYSQLLQTPDTVLLGCNRSIRSDEWMVNTPLAFSQYYNNFDYYSEIVRGFKTDMFMVYGQPVNYYAIIFRPFFCGYLFLSPGMGLSFFWVGRFIILFLISLEFGMLLCRKKRILSLAYAVCIALSPIVQWWFAVNFIAEIFIFGQLGVILIVKYATTKNSKNKFLYAIGIIWTAGGYIFALYPAWQVPCAYVFLALLIAFIKEKKYQLTLQKKDIFFATIIMILIALFTLPVFFKSKETIDIVKNTVYPGSRFVTGLDMGIKDFLFLTLNGINGLVLPFKDLSITNNCEAARIIDLAPLGLILSLTCWFKCKKIDSVTKIMLILLFIFICWSLFSWPVMIAKYTLLYTVNQRIVLGIGFINILLLFRYLSVYGFRISRPLAFLFAVCGAGVAVYLMKKYGADVYSVKYYGLVLVVTFSLWYNACRMNTRFFSMLLILTCLVAGGMVNPIARGTASIYSSPVVKKIQQIAVQDQGLWIVNSKGPEMNNIPIMAGAPTINSINTYPVMERWEKLDQNHEFSNVYNRYAHIMVQIKDGETKFILGGPDNFKVDLNIKDVRLLNVKYVFSDERLSDYDGDSIFLKQIFEENGKYIYQVVDE